MRAHQKQTEPETIAWQREMNMPMALEFSRLLGQNPDLARRLPQGARVVMVPSDNVVLAALNLKMAADMAANGETVVLVQWPIRVAEQGREPEYKGVFPFGFIGIGERWQSR